ncbi:MAG: lectin-like protein [Planctomycetota bacterium]
MKASILTGLLAITLPSLALAQGANDCASATPISGEGIFAFDQTSATASGVVSSCGSINADVWFAWTSATGGFATLSTCGLASHDTKVAAYDSCGGSSIACNDDDCALQSKMTWLANPGQTYYLQIGTYGSTPGNTGSIEITVSAPQVDPSSGSGYMWFPNQGGWDACQAFAQSMVINGVAGHLVTLTSDAERAWVVANVADLANNRSFIGLYQDLNDPNYSEPLGGWKWVTGEPVTYTNWLAGEPNNGSGGIEHVGEIYGAGGWNDVPNAHLWTTGCIVEWDFGTTGVPFCNPAMPNSTGLPTYLAIVPSAVSGSGYHLDATQGPPNQFGYFLVGSGSNPTGTPISQGLLCLALGSGNQLGRYNVGGTNLNSVGLFDASGVFVNVVGTSSTGNGYDLPNTVPVTGSPTFQTGSTWYFQLWHREDGGQSNFSNGIALTF